MWSKHLSLLGVVSKSPKEQVHLAGLAKEGFKEELGFRLGFEEWIRAYIYFLIEFIGVTLVNKLEWVRLFFNYILLIMLLQFSQCLPLGPPPHSTPHSLRPSPHCCSCPWVMHINSLATPFPMLYFTSPWLFCNYLFVLLNPLTSSPIPPQPLPSSNLQKALRIHDSVSVLLVCLVCLLDSIVDKYLFIAILLFIVLIPFFYLNKSL